MPDWLAASLKTAHKLDTEANTLDHLVTNIWIGKLVVAQLYKAAKYKRSLATGGRPTTSPLHYDDYENFLCQIVGQKEVNYIDKKYILLDY